VSVSNATSALDRRMLFIIWYLYVKIGDILPKNT
jgi:hypothetical protein